VKRSPLLVFLIAFIAGSLAFFFVKDKEAIKKYTNDIPVDTTMRISLIGLSDKNVLSNWSVLNAAYVLGSRNEKVCGHVGYASIECEEYRMFLKLKNIATNEDLLNLIESKNPVIKAYAIQALSERDFPGIIKIFEKHISDKDVFTDQCGCIGLPVRINVYFLKCLSSKLNTREYKKYKKVILTMYPESSNPFNDF
jgi:hypothetical protein